MSRSLALEWGRHGIRVNNVAPGPIAGTPALAMLPPEMLQSVEAKIAKSIPLGRMGLKRDCAEACLYLCLAPYVTGQTVDVDGGESLWGGPPVMEADRVAEEARPAELRKRA